MHVYEVAEQAAYHVGYGSKNTACRTVLNDNAAYAQYVSKNSHERRLSECTYGTWVRVHGTLCVCVCTIGPQVALGNPAKCLVYSIHHNEHIMKSDGK